MPDLPRLSLLEWYRQNSRALPWRASRDPYRIWISETMLQQTTTTAVIPFFERFVARFPSLSALADAPEGAVVEAWAGLGYYSRARNLHKSARALARRGGFPRRFEELIELPGFGPYTARSVASLAFDQSVGVVDGNVIRVLSRVEAEDWAWWKSTTRAEIQAHADRWVEGVSAYAMNQALMELGRTICTPKSPACLLCPIRRPREATAGAETAVNSRAAGSATSGQEIGSILRPEVHPTSGQEVGCRAYALDRVKDFPRPRPRRDREIWAWRASVCVRDGQILLAKNSAAPFLRGQWLLPAVAERLDVMPKIYDYRHSITHHDIFVTVSRELPKILKAPTDIVPETKWVELKEIRQHVPVSLVAKALQVLDAFNPADGADAARELRVGPARGPGSGRRSQRSADPGRHPR